ncbi:hypothetical protein PT2222_410034 [Paraburkholderia tropica]
MTQCMGSRDPVPRVSTGNTKEYLHYERHREYQLAAKQDHQGRGHFPSDDEATKLIWVGLRNITAGWGGAHDWEAAMNQFAILYAIDSSSIRANVDLRSAARYRGQRCAVARACGCGFVRCFHCTFLAYLIRK